MPSGVRARREGLHLGRESAFPATGGSLCSRDLWLLVSVYALGTRIGITQIPRNGITALACTIASPLAGVIFETGSVRNPLPVARHERQPLVISTGT